MGKDSQVSNDGLVLDEDHAFEQVRAIHIGEVCCRLVWDEPAEFRFLKLTRNDDGSWFMIAGAYAPCGTPVVCMASGDTLRACMDKFRRRSEAAHWQVDKFAQDDDDRLARFAL